ncbi:MULTISPECIES: hypothetical protein [unclassified Mesorhizobium]|uniref:hypothetical protein n=1 Tax=unclassified Mesorhizobium TaxID=325217 RepID=UPI001676F2F6|nr:MULTISPECIES: hypothetical protein [unclassified Mesorhizobium]
MIDCRTTGRLQIRGEALEIDNGRLLNLRIQATTIDPPSKLLLRGADTSKQQHGIGGFHHRL